MGRLHLSPDILEVEESLLPFQPLDSSHRAFGKSHARFGIVTQINCVIGRVEHDLMHAHYIALPERSDFYFHPRRVTNDLLQGYRGSRGGVLFLRMVAFEDVSQILML